MDYTDKKIAANMLARQIGKAVQEWAEKYSVDEPVEVAVTVDEPACHVGRDGKVETGRLVVVYVDFPEEEEED